MSLCARDVYVAGVLAGLRANRPPEGGEVQAPGLHGMVGARGRRVMLLVCDDRAADSLGTMLAHATSGLVTVLGTAARCGQLLRSDPGWRCTELTAMARRDLRTLPEPPLPPELTALPIRRVPSDPPGGAELEDAAALAMRCDPSIVESLPELVAYLRSLRPSTRLLAAVDGSGAVRATAGTTAFGSHASILFVNTDAALRGRGIGRAMTALALRAARETGARHARLDATAAARSVYDRLGFETVDAVRRFTR